MHVNICKTRNHDAVFEIVNTGPFAGDNAAAQGCHYAAPDFQLRGNKGPAQVYLAASYHERAHRTGPLKTVL